MDLRLDGPPGRAARAVQAPPCAMVIFGSSGDLTKRLLIPALYNLAKAGRLSDKFALIGARAWVFLAARMTHLKGDVTDPAMYEQLGKALQEAETAHGTAGNVVF